MKRLVMTLTAVAVAALLVPAGASAIIQVNRGIAGARLGNTKPQVRAALGQPVRVTTGNNEFGPFTVFHYRGRIRVFFQSGNRVTSVETTGRSDRTVRNVGVGSTRQAVVSRVPGVSCQAIPGGRLCQTGSGLPGQRVTAFFIRGCRTASGRIVYVERVDPDGDGDAHFVLLSREGITAPGMSVIDVKKSLRPSPLPGPGDRISAAGTVATGSYGQRQIEAVVLRVAR